MTPDEDAVDATSLLNDMRRAARTLQDRGISEEAGMDFVEQFAILDTYLDEGGVQPDQWRNKRRGRPREEEDGEVLDNVAHGTRAGYNRGCRCQRCRKANREHAANLRVRKKENAES